ncbi:uncharacterized protein [Physcomitrium patens]|uniref:uncharacterized protein isoform X3 n=1 Tax=Physcomitrium patens TaxID=3218 RepID=UPI003CCE0866
MRFSVERKRKPTRVVQRPAAVRMMGDEKTRPAEALVAEMGKRVQEIESKRKQEPGEWTKEGCVLAYERGLQEGQGLHPPPHVLPYKPLGVVDVSRDRALLPVQYRVYKRSHSRREGCRKETPDPVPEEILKSMDSVSLPLNVKSASWNGEQWCSLGFSPRNAEVANGYAMLRDEVIKSHNRLHHTNKIIFRMGRFFLNGLYLEKPRAKSISYLQPIEATETNFRPYIPPLPLANIARYQIEAQIEDNKHLLNLYREEAKRTLYSYRKASAKVSMENSPMDKRKQYGGLPVKACSKLALKTLDKILDDSMKFDILQAKYNFDLLKQLAATKSTRAYMFPRNYAALKELQNAKDFICEPGMASQRAQKFRSMLLKFPWYEVLISLILHDGQHPNKSEIYILDHIRLKTSLMLPITVT